MSLANCLLKHAKLLSGLDTSSIREAADEYVAAGMSKIEAERKATDDKLAELAFDRARVEREILAQYKEMNPTALILQNQTPAELQAKKESEEKNATKAEEKRIADLERDQPLQLQGQDTSAERREAEAKRAQGDLLAGGKITDFGEKIGGAKKDVWTGFKDQLGEVSDADIASKKLSEIWPVPDYQTLIDGGMDQEAVAMIRAFRDEVPAKPRKSYKVTRWAEQVKTLRDMATRILEGKQDLAEVRRGMAVTRGMTGLMGRVDLYVAVGHEKSLEGIRMAHQHYSLYHGKENVRLWVVERDAAATAFSNWPQELATGDTKERAIEAFKAKYDSLNNQQAAKTASFDIWSERGKEGYYVGKKIGRNYAKLAGPFATVKEAREYNKNSTAELEARLEKYKEIPRERKDTNAPRVGEDMRNGQDVTPEFFGQTFGFRGVEFGNWVEQKRRQKDLNDAFDALMDMAAVLGIPPKAISLNGELGLAFGARGSGGVNPAAAHYEPGKVVINLTKKEGAGSLGHEWWHALDNYFSRGQGRPGFKTNDLDVSLAARGSDFMGYPGMRKEMVTAFGAVMKSIKQTAMKVRSAKLDAKRNKEYWGGGEELSARAFEAYLISKLQDQEASNDYLANVVDEKVWNALAALGMENEDSYPYPTQSELPSIRAGFDQFFSTIQAKETDAGTALYARDGDDPLFARNQKQAQSIQASDARAATEVITKKWKNAPKITVHESLTSDSVPAGLRNAMEKEGVTDARGAWYAGAIELFPSNIGSLAELERTIVHEARHYGLEGLFGKDMNPILMEIYLKDKGVRTEANRLVKTLKVSTVDAVNETLANMPLDAAKKLPGWQKLIARLKAWLNDHGFTNLAKMLEGPSADAITKDILYQVEQFVKTGKRGDTTFTTTLFHRAFHGSPHDHDGFSLDKIGTGEGAQAYGYGHYFAGAREVAEYYKNALTRPKILGAYVNGRYTIGDPIYYAVEKTLEKNHSATKAEVLEHLQGRIDAYNSLPEAMRTAYQSVLGLREVTQAYKRLEKAKSFDVKVEKKTPGKLYEVELAPKQEDYLDWDKPLSEQSEKVRGIIEAMMDDGRINAEDAKIFKQYDSPGSVIYKNISMDQAERDVNDSYPGAQLASNSLKSAGIPGIRFLDGSSRDLRILSPSESTSGKWVVGPRIGDKAQQKYFDDEKEARDYFASKSHSNYVIFDDKDVSIVAKYARTAADAPKKWDAPEPSKMDSILYKLADKQIDLKRVTEAVRDGIGEIQETWDAYLKETLFHGRSAKRVATFAQKELKPLLTEMQMRGVEIPELETYLHNRHAEERNKQVAKINPKLPDRGSGITTKDARAYLAGLTTEQRTKYEALAKRIDAITKGTRQTLQDYGLMSTAEMAKWEGAYKHYVPLMKDTEVTGQGEGFSIRGDESKRALGDGAIDSNILANLMAQRERAIVRGEKNRVALSLYGLAKLNPNADFWSVDNPPIIRRVVKLSDKTDRRTIPLGMDIPENATEVVVEGPDPMFLSRENVIVTKYYNPATDTVTEKAIVFNEDNPRAVRMAAALKNLDADQMVEIMNVMAKATRFLASVNTQYNPIFGLVNLTRDVQGAMLNLTSTELAGKQKQVLAGTLAALKGVYLTERGGRKGRAPSGEWGALWDEFQEVGGQTGYRDLFTSSQDRADALQREINKITEGKVKQAGRAIFDWLSDYNQAMENSVRLAAYKVGLDQGLSKEAAANVAKNLTVNFNRKGQITQQAGALYAFFNASVQGTARLAQTLKGPAGKRILIGGLILGALQAMMLAGFDEDEPPQFERERNLIIPIGGKDYFKIPMPLGLHVIPNISRILIEMGIHGKPMDRLFQLMSVTVDAFNPVGAVGLSVQTVLPTVLDPFAALGENRDWTGKPIAREDFSSLNPTPGHSRSKDTASIISKTLSEGLNWASGGTEYTKGKLSPTPDQLDYLFGQVGGGVWREVSKFQQSISAGFTGEELPPYKIPVIGRFYGSTGSQASKSALFYRNLKQLNAHEAEIEGRQKAGQDPSDYIRDNPDSELYQAANRIEREISKRMKQKRQMVKDNAPKSDVKDLENEMAELMHEFNQEVSARRGK